MQKNTSEKYTLKQVIKAGYDGTFLKSQHSLRERQVELREEGSLVSITSCRTTRATLWI